MTKNERFVPDERGCVYDIEAEGYVPDIFELLNGLYEENQYLRELLDIGKTNAKDIVDVLNAQQNAIKELTKESEYLKKKHKDILKLEKENEELKREMRIKDALSIAEWVKKNIKYGYYDNSSDTHKWLEEERRRALNCSDRDKVDLNRKRR